MKRIILYTIGVILLLFGLFLVFKDPVIEYLRKQKIETVIEQMEDSSEDIPFTIVVSPNGYEVPGELDGMSAEEIAAELNSYDGSVILNGIGILTIESASIRIPVWDGATIVALRYGGGHVEESAMPGEIGNCVILGHHMIDETIFHNLDQTSLGDIVQIDTVDGNHYEYVVDEILIVSAAELINYLDKDIDENSRVTLVTCCYTAQGKMRLLVRGTLASC